MSSDLDRAYRYQDAATRNRARAERSPAWVARILISVARRQERVARDRRARHRQTVVALGARPAQQARGDAPSPARFDRSQPAPRSQWID